MNRLLTLSLCIAAVGSINAQKAIVDQAAKLAGKTDKLEEARSLIRQAMENPETKDQARTYFVAGEIEFKAYDNSLAKRAINPDDPSVAGTIMAEELLNGYNYLMQALPLDSLPNEKGEVKPKYSKDIIKYLAGHTNDYFNAGGEFFNSKLYYPQAYDAFMIFSELPGAEFLGKSAPVIAPEQIATSYFNAGLSAYSGDEVDASAIAFEKSRLAGYEQPEAYIYEIACWQTIAQRDESRIQEAQRHIMEAAKAGNEKFGLEQPIFINNMINSLVSEGQIDSAISQLNEIIAANPDSPALYGLRGYVFDRADRNDESEADYRKAVTFADVDFETLKNASKKLLRMGTMKLNDIQGNSEEDNAARQNIKVNYFEAAQKIADQAATMNPNDPDLLNILDSLDYALTTFFN